ncbi:hypothetical protein Nepgr_031395 [Nepenthes gracilis]|uniref:Uncharacterized protein n=1 Tax=Nepenthes gracilis TaxID=150966 RepID=A0AAD3TIR5_NEPGR|nr:hypothetical protein Nepgr_031395 [Nepenthes gracilis]
MHGFYFYASQKYRIFLRRVSEARSCGQNGMPKSWNDRPLRSSFALGHFPFWVNNFGQAFPIASHQSNLPSEVNNQRPIITSPNPINDVVAIDRSTFICAGEGDKQGRTNNGERIERPLNIPNNSISNVYANNYYFGFQMVAANGGHGIRTPSSGFQNANFSRVRDYSHMGGEGSANIYFSDRRNMSSNLLSNCGNISLEYTRRTSDDQAS